MTSLPKAFSEAHMPSRGARGSLASPPENAHYRIATDFNVRPEPVYDPVEMSESVEEDREFKEVSGTAGDSEKAGMKAQFTHPWGSDPTAHPPVAPVSPQRARAGTWSSILGGPGSGNETAMRKRRRSTVATVTPSDLVTWEGVDDPQNPKNWHMRRKWTATCISSLFTFMAPVSSSMVAPALPEMARDLHSDSPFHTELMLSIFILAFAVGPLLFGPVSEIFGRVRVLQTTNLFYLIFNIACGFATTQKQMLAFRFLAGLGGSAPSAIAGGVLGDCWWPEERGKAVAAYSLAPLLGPAIGPIAGGFIVGSISWRWIFWITSIADACIQLFGVFFLQETYGPELLHRKAKALRRATGNEALHTEYEHAEISMWMQIASAIARPFRMLATQPIVQALAIFMMYLYGLTFLIYATFTTLWTQSYGQSVGISGLHYISLSIGFAIGTQVLAPTQDRIYHYLKGREKEGLGKPEFRIPLLYVSIPLVVGGLLIYGWTAEKHVFWLVPDLGMVVFSIGCDVSFQCMTTYTVDTYTRFAASALAAMIFLRSIAGFGFPLFAPALFHHLGYGWGSSMLALTAIVIGLPAPFLLWTYGPYLRSRSTFASG